MSNYLPWLEAPRNKEEFDQLEERVQALTEEMYAKLQIISVQVNHRLRRPKSGSKWAQKLAWARVDLRVYARSVSKPIATSAGAVLAVGKAFRRAHTEFHSIQRVTAHGDGSGSGFDFS